jgi:hypothetical protein
MQPRWGNDGFPGSGFFVGQSLLATGKTRWSGVEEAT